MSHSYNKKYQTWNIVNISKKPSQMDHHVRCFVTFRSNDQYYGYNRDKVCDNVSMLCTHVHLGMTNMLDALEINNKGVYLHIS